MTDSRESSPSGSPATRPRPRVRPPCSPWKKTRQGAHEGPTGSHFRGGLASGTAFTAEFARENRGPERLAHAISPTTQEPLTGCARQHPQKLACRFELRGTVADYCTTASAHLAPGGCFVTFAYYGFHQLPGGRRFRALLERLLPQVTTTEVVWANLPPAFVYVGRK